MKYHVPGTINAILTVPQRSVCDLSQISLPELAARATTYKYTCGLKSPEREAMEFYLLNHLTASVLQKFKPDEVLPDLERSIVEAYAVALAHQSERMFWYMLLIIIRESRHLHGNKMGLPWWKTWTEQFGEKHKKFWESIYGSDSEFAVDRFLSCPPDTDLGRFVHGIELQFEEGKFGGGGFGGKPWAQIARTLKRFVHGEISAEMMVDTAYTLAHNNGPIFNKGMMYEPYQHEFIMVLDVQHSGQIPESVLDFTLSHYAASNQAGLLHEFRAKYPDEFVGYVDWFKVEADGAKGSYPQQKKKQKAKGQKITGSEVQMITLWPGLTVKTIQRSKAA